jgi:PAS domain S-box-containing protein
MAQVEEIITESQAKPIWAEIMRAAVAVARQSSHSEDDLLNAVVEELRRLNLNGTVMLLSKDGFLAVKGTPSGLEKALRKLTGREAKGFRFKPEEVDIYREVLSTAEPIFTLDRQAILQQIVPSAFQSITTKIIGMLGDHPMIYAPMIIAEQPLGIMNVSAEWLTLDDLPMVSSLADHIAISLNQIRTGAETKLTLERESLRMRVADVAASFTDLPDILDRILQLTTEATGANASAIALIDPNGETLQFHHLIGLPKTLSDTPIPRNKGLTWQLVESREPLLISEYAEQADALPEWIQVGVRGLIGVPLITSDKVIGAIGLFMIGEESTFSEEDLRMAMAVSHFAAGVIHNAQLYQEATQLADEANSLREGAIAISSSLDLNTVLTEIAQQAKTLLKVDGSRIHLLDPETQVLKCLVALHPRADKVMDLELQAGEGLAGYVLQSGEPLIVNRPIDHPNSIQIPGTPEDEAEVLALVPLIRRQRTMGVMTVLREGYERPFQDSDLRLLVAFASQAAVAIENAHLYGQIEAQALRLEDIVAARTRELYLSEARYRSLVENSVTGIYQLDENAKVVYVNSQLAEMVELSPDELKGRSVADFLAPENRSQVIDRALARIRGEGPPTEIYEVDLLSWSGRRIPVILAVSLITDDEGKSGGVSGLVLDISRRKDLEAALRTERDRLDAILTNVGDSVLVTDAEGMIEYVNPGWERLNGYSADEALGKKPNILKSGVQADEFYEDIWETIVAGHIWSGEVVNRRKDGSTYEAALTITPVLNENGEIVNFVGLQHDISILKELDRLKSQFVSDVSHELRTPLTNIRLYLDLLRQTEYDQRAERYMDTLSRESERLSTLIEDLLSLSRMEADTVPIDTKPVNINELLSALAEDRGRLAAQYGLDLRIECEANLPPALGDERLLSQVFTNLLTNALNYTPKGGNVSLRTQLKSNPHGRWVTTAFQDTGYGISPKELPLIFRRFFRGQASKPANVAGTGLGLAICKEIAERHGGKITVESDGIMGHGSTFTVWLPAGDQES